MHLSNIYIYKKKIHFTYVFNILLRENVNIESWISIKYSLLFVHTNIYSIQFSFAASHVTILHFLHLHAENLKKKIIKRESHLSIIYMCWKSRKARGVTFEMKYTNYIARRPWNFPQVFRDAETASFPAFPRKFFRSEKRVKPARKWRAYITGHN